ncbi:triose-phosphate isomerase [Campylobacter insulaenigrae]|uniref:triose-phosphate isomerase n=1 Tax=Campylobacter insulaenigrae TaxID=260714 RepID=UPI0021520367|nr:triose-phosphate isomerase [Campylobacter insulaenigrae]MCR6572076.1 triose-phosphate isomerase [Campylobacter insulaenigrae]MCR6578102.1 triose-phosphate isomerase [Campylobacter insulaenigrae]MCR6581048.1 triose-phosphate isomerase [Campylobacter insulaenigrae]MCR6584341.1 triose-phosphate isomerase [Campylobacter insulaenigrae]
MIFAANLKCNHTRSSFQSYAEEINSFKNTEDEIFIFPSNTSFLMQKLNFYQGAQNFYPCINGAYTGEIGQEHLEEFNIKSVLIGHSERRVLGENEKFLKTKFDFAKNLSYNIIYCIGESLEIKQEKKSLDFLKKQIENIDLDYEKLIIAYEPIYSIGTGVSASIEDIKEKLNFLSQFSKCKFLYGGSVNQDNIKDICSLQNCHGVLIGTAALQADKFLKLIQIAKG